MRISKRIKNIIRKVKFIGFDFDGVFTNNKVVVDKNGNEYVVCNRADGIGLSKLRRAGIEMMILSSEPNRIVVKRAKKLKINCLNNCDNKYKVLNKIIKHKRIALSEVAFVGNDINDEECLANVGLPIIVADAHREVKKSGRMITELKGGQGAVREICDLIYSVKSEYNR